MKRKENANYSLSDVDLTRLIIGLKESNYENTIFSKSPRQMLLFQANKQLNNTKYLTHNKIEFGHIISYSCFVDLGLEWMFTRIPYVITKLSADMDKLIGNLKGTVKPLLEKNNLFIRLVYDKKKSDTLKVKFNSKTKRLEVDGHIFNITTGEIYDEILFSKSNLNSDKNLKEKIQELLKESKLVSIQAGTYSYYGYPITK